MGFEKGATTSIAGMLLLNRYGGSLPRGPRGPHSGGGTPNHDLLSRVARVAWTLERGDARQRLEELAGIERFFANQIALGFMTRGEVTEQISPSHSQWWITAVLALRWIGRNHPDASQMLLAITGRWLCHHHALCRLFATPKGVVAPGARAWPQPVPGSNKPYYGKCKLRDELYTAIETGKVRKIWPAGNLDMLGLVFADKLFKAGDDLGGAKKATALPKLKWPISYRREGGSFSSWLTSIEGNAGLETQRLATWRDGKESYGFDDAQEESWGERRIIGSGMTVRTSP